MMLLDSPLNRAGMLQVYIHTEKNVLIEINPHVRIPRTFKRFCGLIGRTIDAFRVCQKYAVVQYAVFVFSIAVQLLHKLSIHADDGPMKLMKVLYVCMCVCD